LCDSDPAEQEQTGAYGVKICIEFLVGGAIFED
jgi:hypothetical protein